MSEHPFLVRYAKDQVQWPLRESQLQPVQPLPSYKPHFVGGSCLFSGCHALSEARKVEAEEICAWEDPPSWVVSTRYTEVGAARVPVRKLFCMLPRKKFSNCWFSLVFPRVVTKNLDASVRQNTTRDCPVSKAIVRDTSSLSPR